jgi:hypothetical protein
VRAVEQPFEIDHADYLGFGDQVASRRPLAGLNALVQCKERQVFAVPTVTLVREGFSTNFSTFLLKSFDRGGCRLPDSSRMTDSFPDRKKKTFPIRHSAVNHFRGAFFDAAAVRMLE